MSDGLHCLQTTWQLCIVMANRQGYDVVVDVDTEV